MDLLSRLLPSPARLHLNAVEVDEATRRIVLQLTSLQPEAVCPCCGSSSRRIHSHYTRSVLDLPWAICLHLDVRKFRCMQAGCPRTIFCERLPSVVAPWARSTDRLRERQRHIGLALGAEPASA